MEADWAALIGRADAVAARTIEARIHVGPAGSGGSEAQRFTCRDGYDYAVKDPNNPQGLRVLFNDQMGARIARLMGAPVPAARIVEVPAALAGTITFSNGSVAAGGPCHGSQWIDRDVRSAPDGATHTTPPENARRFAALAVLFTLIHNTDHQFLYATTTPRVVYSVDHGHSLGGSPTWTASSLMSAAPPTTIDWISGMTRRAMICVPSFVACALFPPRAWRRLLQVSQRRGACPTTSESPSLSISAAALRQS